MERYRDSSGKSAIYGYELLPEGIQIHYKDGTSCLFTNSGSGAQHISRMRQLAIVGYGLSSYIKKYLKPTRESEAK
jgi:hypothetical protein